MKYIISLILCISFYTPAIANQHEIDSLNTLFNKEKVDSIKINYATELYKSHKRIKQYDSSLYYLDQILTLQQVTLGNKILAKTNSRKGLIYLYMNKYDSAEHYYKIALEYSDTTIYTRNLGAIYANLGAIMWYKNNYPFANSYYFQELKIQKKLKDTTNIINCYANIALSYKHLFKNEKAIEYNFNALILADSSDNYTALSNIYNSIATIYGELENRDKEIENYLKAEKYFKLRKYPPGTFRINNNLGVYYLKTMNHEQALKHFKIAKQISDSIILTDGMVQVRNNLASVYLKLGEQEKAIALLNEGFAIANKSNNTKLKVINYRQFGEVYSHLNNHKKAIYFLEQSLNEAEKINYLTAIKKSTQLLHESYSIVGDYKKAYKSSLQFKMVSDSLLNEKNIKEFTQAEMQYDFDKQHAEQEKLSIEKEYQHSIEIKNQKYQRNLVGIIAIFILALGTLGFVLYRITQNRKLDNLRKSLILNMQKSMSQQMNPHFIFNTLNSIQHFVSKNNTEATMGYITKFASLIRTMFDYSHHYSISLQEEISALKNYAGLESLRFTNNMQFEVKIDDKVDIDSFKIPTFILQPILENAIKHGLQPLEGKGIITLSIEKSIEGVVCKMSDTGVGIEASEQNKNKEHKSGSTKLIHKRLSILSQYYKKQFSFEYEHNKNVGTVAILSLPSLV